MFVEVLHTYGQRCILDSYPLIYFPIPFTMT